MKKLIHKCMKFLRSGAHRVEVAAVLTLLIVISFNAGANPQVQYKSNNGWMFLVNGVQLFCGLDPKRQGKVLCFNQKKERFICDFREAPEYFTNCVRDE